MEGHVIGEQHHRVYEGQACCEGLALVWQVHQYLPAEIQENDGKQRSKKDAKRDMSKMSWSRDVPWPQLYMLGMSMHRLYAPQHGGGPGASSEQPSTTQLG